MNAPISCCFYCGGAKEAIYASSLLRHPEQQRTVHDMDSCDHCTTLMKFGVVLISVEDGEKRRDRERYMKVGSAGPIIPNPARSGSFVVLREDVVRAKFRGAADGLLMARWAFIEDAAWDLYGLPRGTTGEGQA